MSNIEIPDRVGAVEHAQHAHEAVCAIRYQMIIETLERMRVDHAAATASITQLQATIAQRAGAQAMLGAIGSIFALMLGGIGTAVITHFWGAR